MFLSFYSIFTAILCVTVFIKIISLLRKRMLYLQHFSLDTLLFLLLLCVLRLLFPLELPYTVILNSKKIMPAFQNFFQKPLFLSDHVHIAPAHLLTTAWITGAAVLLIRRIWEYQTLKHVLFMFPVSNNKHLYHLLTKAGLQRPKKNVKIIVHKSITTPASIGCIHPIILMPDIYFEDDELLGIFIHEAAHIQLNHHLVKLSIELICICFWWNPFFKDLFSETAYALEMHADQTVCKKLNQEQQRKYLHVIIKIFMHGDQKDFSSVFTCSFLEHADSIALKQRFQMILEDHYHSKNNSLSGIAVLAFCIFMLSYSFIPQPYSEPRTTDYGYIDTSTNQNFYYIKAENGFDLYEYPNRFLDHIDAKKDCLPWLQIYKNMEDMKRKWKKNY